MHNGYYRVFVGITQPQTWSVYRHSWHPEIKERNKLLLLWGLGITILMLAIVIPLSVINAKKEKQTNEGLQDRLIRLCNPANFMKKYDKKKVDNANEIYNQLQTPNLSDDTLLELQKRAVEELGVSIIDEHEIRKLKEKVNPKHYMKPYDAEKVSLANELFARISKEGLKYEEFIEIERKSQKL